MVMHLIAGFDSYLPLDSIAPIRPNIHNLDLSNIDKPDEDQALDKWYRGRKSSQNNTY